MQTNQLGKAFLFSILLAGAASYLPAAIAADAEAVAVPQPAWQSLTSKERKEVLAFAEDYKDFMSRAKTELSFVVEAVKIVERAGIE